MDLVRCDLEKCAERNARELMALINVNVSQVQRMDLFQDAWPKEVGIAWVNQESKIEVTMSKKRNLIFQSKLAIDESVVLSWGRGEFRQINSHENSLFTLSNMTVDRVKKQRKGINDRQKLRNAIMHGLHCADELLQVKYSFWRLHVTNSVYVVGIKSSPVFRKIRPHHIT